MISDGAVLDNAVPEPGRGAWLGDVRRHPSTQETPPVGTLQCFSWRGRAVEALEGGSREIQNDGSIADAKGHDLQVEEQAGNEGDAGSP